MGPGNTKRDNGSDISIKFLLLTSSIIVGSFSLILGMCLVAASAVEQLGRYIGGVVDGIIGNPFPAVFAELFWMTVACVAFLAATAWGELAWLLLALLGLLLFGGAL
jgi:hypothetical protein